MKYINEVVDVDEAQATLTRVLAKRGSTRGYTNHCPSCDVLDFALFIKVPAKPQM